MKPRIFIGSSSEGKKIASFVKKTLEPEFECILWHEDGKIFGINVSYLDSLLKAGSMFDFGILVATQDDTTTSRKRKSATPRDNVIFEFGLFMGRLGKFRTLILQEEGTKLPSDMNGIHISSFTGSKNGMPNASLKKQLENIRTHINERYKLQELGLLPSTGVAMGYYSNFVERVCNYLRPKQNEIINGITYSSFEVQIIIPNSLERNMQNRAQDYFKEHSFKEHTFKPETGREIKTMIVADKTKPEKLIICDMPTTLTPLYDAIEMYLQKGHTGKSKEQELIEARELNNFVAVLKAKMNEDSFNKKIVNFIEEIKN